jgi:hypothetical protein
VRVVICDDSDRELWLKERRKKITASEMLVFLDRQPDWYSTNKEELLAQKLDGTEPLFDHKAKVRMNHGRLDEANNLAKVGKLLGYPVAEYHQFVGNDRWPYLGATLDGLLFPHMAVEPDLELTMQEGRVLETIDFIGSLGGDLAVGQSWTAHDPLLVELKQTEAHRYGKNGKPWIDFVPDYYIPQVQTQMWLADVERMVLVGCLGAADMTTWIVKRDPEWEGILDAANSEAFAVLGAT